MGKREIYFLQPSTSWNEALPLGNGRLGGMVNGGAFDETISLNEDSVWYGGFTDRNNPDAYVNLSEVRKLIFEGDIRAAERLALLSMCGIPNTQRHYEPLGDFRIRYMGLEKSGFENYRRSLDLQTGLALVSFTAEGGKHERETFISFPAQVMAVRIKAENARAFLGVNIDRQRGRYADTVREPLIK
ncbi:MAG: glycoside hydrolase family 95 protein [Treponema sp.]|jgi:alpha-L-fucosidase 2|nr:glycoside hydrolase family 95 protein [Treponema sp.]